MLVKDWEEVVPLVELFVGILYKEFHGGRLPKFQEVGNWWEGSQEFQEVVTFHLTLRNVASSGEIHLLDDQST